MREQIAVLDGLGMFGPYEAEMSDPYVQDYRAFSSDIVTPVPGNGQNYTGGSDWFEGAPTRLQQEGLANLNGLGMDPHGYAGSRVGPVPGNGQNYSGGSSWFPGAPTRLQQEGLASGLSIEEVPGWAGERYMPVPGGGANYTGGSDWAPGFPTSISSQGLVGLGRLRGMSGAQLRAWARCGVLMAMRRIGVSRTSGDIATMVERIVRSDWPRGVDMTQRSVAYLAALYTARAVGATMADARRIAASGALLCT